MNKDIIKALEILNAGGIILYPTDTIWGIGCDATNKEAVAKIYELKKRADSKSMLVLMDNINSLDRYMEEVPEMAYDLVELSEKPITIIYPGAKNIASNLIAEDGTLGIRVTSEKFSAELIRRFRKPIVSTSANISGEPSPQNFSEISEEIKNGVDFIVEYRQEETNNPAPSSIIKLGVGGEIQILRK
ncbi:threonylcarbamoyl-AMP synthase [Prolixibacteraceae bacterium JC049]|nr:threonylcarbamoyl-AMP synthase [Prolixibacteraceae bacterium JC049]